MKSFHKILIANRGEIAVRVIRTCRALGIASVAVYSDADSKAPHVREADDAIHIGPPSSQESYLNIEKIISAARQTGTEAIHPGYGFLAENAEFAAACEAAGLVFIGPSAEAIRRMGLKSLARKIMAEAGVPVVPGYDGEDQRLETLRKKALKLGLPVLIKASAGGGGKGMRVVREAAEIEAALEGARREAEKAFGDGTLLLEKYLENARHVEFQILGDERGNLVHLCERDCSIQRRHQKIIEESPSPALTPELRVRMGEAAIKVGRAIGYANAGTVEFLLTPSGEFYFIEVNTRLQVEHPVTELTTGLDLVRLQIEIAEGRPLPFAQAEIRAAGHAIEARLYAEDPDHDFLPATGTLCDWHLPPAIAGLRMDSGVERGMEIGIHYDPLLAKLIAHGPDRETALRKLGYGLRSLSAQGVQTNRDFLIRLLDHPEFRRGRAHTGFIGEHLAQLLAVKDRAQDLTAAAVVALYLQQSWHAATPAIPRIPPNYRNNPYRAPSVKLQVGDEVLEISYRWLGADRYEVACGDWQTAAQVVSCEPGLRGQAGQAGQTGQTGQTGKISLSFDGAQQQYRVTEAGEQFYVHSFQSSRRVMRLPRYPIRHAASEQESANAPMPGQVLRILVEAGQQVKAGEALVILEAMKMEQTIRAAADGVVEAILVKTGEVVAPGDRLVQIAAS
jgi:3-methylcrotonyl-CoA carboxylase alpha subunit